MNTVKVELLKKKQELIERGKFAKIIRDWVEKNKKTFWKYEVSSFHKTYKIRVANLPEPSLKDVILSSNNRLLSDQQKTQLCAAIIKAYSETEVFSELSIDVQIDYTDGAVIAAII